MSLKLVEDMYRLASFKAQLGELVLEMYILFLIFSSFFGKIEKNKKIKTGT